MRAGVFSRRIGWVIFASLLGAGCGSGLFTNQDYFAPGSPRLMVGGSTGVRVWNIGPDGGLNRGMLLNIASLQGQVAISGIGKFLALDSSSQILTFDMRPDGVSPLRSIPISGLGTLHALVAAPPGATNGSTFYLISYDTTQAYLSGFSVDPQSGPVNTSAPRAFGPIIPVAPPYIKPGKHAVHPGGGMIYVGDVNSLGSVWSVSTAAPAPVSCTFPGAVGSLEVHPAGQFLLAGSSTPTSNVYVAQLSSATEAITSCTSALAFNYPSGSGALLSMGFAQGGNYLVGTADSASGYLCSYSITAFSANPVINTSPVSCQPTFGPPSTMVVTRDGRRIYLASTTVNSVSGYSVSDDGQLSPLPGSPWRDDENPSPQRVSIFN